ncbi:MAG: 30S ribosomal protein S12 methylthiotransferase RimO, partial [Desulfobulbus sp.]
MDGEKTMHLVSLGCAKNLVDSEVMLAVLEDAGYAVVENPEQAGLLLVNTCGFIQPAVEEAVDHILQLAEYKKQNRNAILVVCGCLVQRYGDELLKEMPEVDLFVGINEIADIAHLIDRKKEADKPVLHLQPPGFLMKSSTPRRLSTPFFQAYLKITEGCDNRCTYCLIPSIRGDLRSRSIEDLVCEAQRLEQEGVRELCLIAQDLTAYGNDLPGDVSLALLLEQLLRETDIPWFRLLYLYPTNTGDDLLALMAQEGRIVPYLDIPFQHVSDHILRAMHRRYTLADLDQLVTDIRHYLSECALRSTMLVGFPGETEEDVSLLIDYLK